MMYIFPLPQIYFLTSATVQGAPPPFNTNHLILPGLMNIPKTSSSFGLACHCYPLTHLNDVDIQTIIVKTQKRVTKLADREKY